MYLLLQFFIILVKYFKFFIGLLLKVRIYIEIKIFRFDECINKVINDYVIYINLGIDNFFIINVDVRNKNL